MAKKEAETTNIPVEAFTGQPEATVPAVPTQGAAVSLADMADADAGAGLSTKQEDNLIPIVRRLQSNSKAVNKRGPEYVEGAEAGDIYMKGDTPEIIKGEEGIIFQPCAFGKEWVEWIPLEKGGGFVARYGDLPPTAEEYEDDRGRKRYRTPEGNDLVDTRFHIGIWHKPNGDVVPYVITMKSTDHTVSRQWMQRMNGKLLPSKKSAPSWMYTYKLFTKDRTNAAGTWATWVVKDHEQIKTTDDYQRGKALFESFSRGDLKAEVDQEESQGEAQDTM